MIISVPVVSLSSSWVPVSVIVWGVLKTLLSNAIVSAPPAEFAWPTAQRSVPTLPLSSVLVTVNVDSSLRSSSASTVGCIRRRCRAFTVPRAPLC